MSWQKIKETCDQLTGSIGQVLTAVGAAGVGVPLVFLLAMWMKGQTLPNGLTVALFGVASCGITLIASIGIPFAGHTALTLPKDQGWLKAIFGLCWLSLSVVFTGLITLLFVGMSMEGKFRTVILVKTAQENVELYVTCFLFAFLYDAVLITVLAAGIARERHLEEDTMPTVEEIKAFEKTIADLELQLSESRKVAERIERLESENLDLRETLELLEED